MEIGVKSVCFDNRRGMCEREQCTGQVKQIAPQTPASHLNPHQCADRLQSDVGTPGTFRRLGSDLRNRIRQTVTSWRDYTHLDVCKVKVLMRAFLAADPFFFFHVSGKSRSRQSSPPSLRFLVPAAEAFRLPISRKTRYALSVLSSLYKVLKFHLLQGGVMIAHGADALILPLDRLDARTFAK